jgi:catechol 2,3-dioxygenase-like lactoylglutathione lyase family enzyme
VSVRLDHTIVSARDKQESAQFLADILGLAAPVRMGPFVAVRVDNGVALDFADAGDDVRPQHYAFALSDAEFDEAFRRIRGRGLAYWADPSRSRPGQIRQHDGSRGVYFQDPSGHFLEILTHPGQPEPR